MAVECAYGTTTFTFDSDGNQETEEKPSGDITTNTWDYENQNTQVELPQGDVVTTAYSGSLKRVVKETATEETTFIWDGQNILAEVDDVGDTAAQYNYKPLQYGNLVSQHRDTDSDYYHFDALGSTAAMTDSSEVVTNDYTYGAWGDVTSSTGSTENPFQWVGQVGYYRDPETDRTSMRRRLYGDAIGQFLSDDPLPAPMGDSNGSRYANNRPTVERDPSGYAPPLGDQMVPLHPGQTDNARPRSTQPPTQHLQEQFKAQSKALENALKDPTSDRICVPKNGCHVCHGGRYGSVNILVHGFDAASPDQKRQFGGIVGELPDRDAAPSPPESDEPSYETIEFLQGLVGETRAKFEGSDSPYAADILELLSTLELFLEVLKEMGLSDDEVLDVFQLFLDILGLFPGIGNVVDALNVGVSTYRGNFGEAAFSVILAVPALGIVAGLGKIAKKLKTLAKNSRLARLLPVMTKMLKDVASGACTKPQKFLGDLKSKLSSLLDSLKKKNGRVTAPSRTTTSTIGDLRRAGQRDAHHVIQDAAVRDLPGYNTNAAPGVRLEGPANVPGTPHNLTRPVQRQAGGGTYAAERRIGYKALRRAELSPADARRAIQEADDYFRSIGVTPNTPTRIPGDRR